MALRIVTSKTRLLQQRLPRGYPLRLNENHEHARGLIYTVPMESGQPWTIPGEADFPPSAGRLEDQNRALRRSVDNRWVMGSSTAGRVGMPIFSNDDLLVFPFDRVIPFTTAGLDALTLSCWLTVWGGFNNAGLVRGGNDFFIFDSSTTTSISQPWIRWGGTDIKAGVNISASNRKDFAHYCFTGENGGRFGVYKDGAEEWSTTSAATLSAATDATYFGTNTGSERVNGWYHEIRLYNRHVSFEEHREHQLNRAALYRQRARVFPAAAGGGASITASLSAALQQQDQLRSASLSAALQQTAEAGTSIDAAVARALAAAATLNAAISAANAATTTADAALLTSQALTAAIDAVLSAAGTATVTSSLDAAVLQRLAMTVALDAGLQVDGSATVTADAVLSVARDAAASLDAALSSLASVSASMDASLTGASSTSLTVTLTAALQRALAISASLDAAIERADQTVAATLDAVAGSAYTLALALDAMLAVLGTASVSITAAVRAARSLTATLDARIGTAFTPNTKRTLVARAQGRTLIARHHGRTRIAH